MARTEQYTVDQVLRAIERGHTPQGAGSLLGCHAETVRNYAKKYKSVDRALRAERKNLRDAAQNSLLAAVYRGEGWAVMGVFKTIDEDGGYIPQNQIAIQHTGEGGGPITLVVEYVNDRKNTASDAA